MRKQVNFTRNIKWKIPKKEAVANTSDAIVQPSENSLANFCEFQTHEDNNFILQSPTADTVHDKDDEPFTK